MAKRTKRQQAIIRRRIFLSCCCAVLALVIGIFAFIIHAIVNGLSCCYYAILYFTDEETADTAHGFVCLALAGLGFVALLIYISKYKTEFNRVISKKGLEEYTLKQKISKFIFAPAMIIAIIVFLIQAISMISYGTGVTA